MPTGVGSDVIPLRKKTKQRLAKLKGDASYDEVLQRLLDASERGTPPPNPPGPERHPDEQRLLAELAAERWKLWEKEGRIETLGPRLVVYRTREDAQREVKVVWPKRRGFAP